MLGVGNKFPSFELPSCNADNNVGTTIFNDVKDEACDGKWHVFYFYPKDFTFICPTEIKENIKNTALSIILIFKLIFINLLII